MSIGEHNDEQYHLHAIVDRLLQRLKYLELQQASYGMSCPPHIVMEIEDIKAKVANYKLGANFAEKVTNFDEYNAIREDKMYFNRTKKVVIVDDGGEYTEVLTEVLSAEGFVISVAYDGVRGLSKIIQEHPSIVLLDINLPGMDGFEVLSEIVKRRIPTRVIMMTGYAGTSMVVRALKLGACDYLTKPLNLEETIFKVQKAVELDYVISASTENSKTRIDALYTRIYYLQNELVKMRREKEAVERELDMIKNTGANLNIENDENNRR